MKSRITLCLLLMVALAMPLFSGCAKKKLDSTPVGATRPAGELSDEELARRRAEEQAMRERDLAAQQAGRGAGANGGVFSDSQFARQMNADLIYFDYDSFDLRPDAREILQRKAELMKSHPQAQLVIEGHCDQRGTAEYNLALSDKRAKAAYDFLALMGVPSDHMKTVAYGQERPVCTDSSEACFGKNRRDEFKVME